MEKLVAHQVSVQYLDKQSREAHVAVQDISFQVNEGEFLAIVGPSGCGKTTLLSVIAGLVSVTAGEIRLDGQRIMGPGPDRGMVFQSPALMPWRTAIENVAYGLELQGHPAQVARAQAQHYMTLVGLSGSEHRFPHQLSGGMQQRVNLARALAIRPQLLLFDEPLSALDAQTREYMQTELQRIWQEHQTTTIFVTHQISEAIYLSNRVLVLSARPGRIKADVEIPLPRPRHLQEKRQPRFIELENYIWSLLDFDWYRSKPVRSV